MRNLEDIDRDLAQAREALANVEGTPAEVYSRIVGYYRSVRNWNRGKREEYGERKLFRAGSAGGHRGNAHSEKGVAAPFGLRANEAVDTGGRPAAAGRVESEGSAKVLLFVRPACPACPQAKAEAGKLGLPVETLDADTEAGLAEARRRGVLATPTAILLAGDGQELARARSGREIAAFARKAA